MYEPGRFRRRLEQGGTVIGTHVRMTDALLTEMVCELGFEAVFIDMEHTLINKTNVTPLIVAAQGVGASAIVRVPWNDPVLAKPILEMGVDGVIFPWICSAEEARRAVAACTYPPKGNRGFGPIRANHFGLMPVQEYLDQADDALFKIMQVEHVNAVNNLEEILAVEGVDGIVIGPFDLSGSIDILGQLDNPKNKELIRKTFEICRKAGKPYGISAVAGHKKGMDVVKEYIDMGASYIFICSEYDWIRGMAGNVLAEVKAYMGEK